MVGTQNLFTSIQNMSTKFLGSRIISFFFDKSPREFIVIKTSGWFSHSSFLEIARSSRNGFSARSKSPFYCSKSAYSCRVAATSGWRLPRRLKACRYNFSEPANSPLTFSRPASSWIALETRGWLCPKAFARLQDSLDRVFPPHYSLFWPWITLQIPIWNHQLRGVHRPGFVCEYLMLSDKVLLNPHNHL